MSVPSPGTKYSIQELKLSLPNRRTFRFFVAIISSRFTNSMSTPLCAFENLISIVRQIATAPPLRILLQHGCRALLDSHEVPHISTGQRLKKGDLGCSSVRNGKPRDSSPKKKP